MIEIVQFSIKVSKSPHDFNIAFLFQQDGGEISMRMRNGSAHVLRCLKVWYDLPPDTFFNAVNIMDRFLTRMKVSKTILKFEVCSLYSVN